MAITQQVQKSSESLFLWGGLRSGFYTFYHSGVGGNNCSGYNKMMINDCKGSVNADFLFPCQSLRPLANRTNKSVTITLIVYFFCLKINPDKKDNLKINACPHPETFTGHTHGLMNKMKGDMEVVGEWQEDADNRVRWRPMI